MPPFFFRRLVVSALALLCSVAAIASPAVAAGRPKLVVVVSIDQFPFEYLLRMRKGFAEDGFFNAVWQYGAVYSGCHHGQAFTITGPGHSTLLTGAFPNTTGIIDNDWFDRRTDKTVYCVEDLGVQTVGAPGKTSMSPRNLEIGTLGDSLKLASNGRSKVFGVALKDRASILMAGHAANAAYWYDSNAGVWVTSTYYREALPNYLRDYNEAQQQRQNKAAEWNLLLDRSFYEEYYPDNAPWETNVAIIGRSFPHPLPKGTDPGYAKLIASSPAGSEMTLEVARLVTTEEKLGEDDEPDLLCINLSSNDYIGHAFGPYSMEAQDITFRTDRLLADFTRFLDETVGPNCWVLALSSDHGVAPIPEHAVKMKLPARRVPAEHFAKLREKLEGALVKRFGKLPAKTTYVRHLDTNCVYLNLDREELQDERMAAAQRIVRDTLLADDVVAAAFTRNELLQGGNETELFRRLQLAFHPGRSGDVLFAMKPYYLGGNTGTTHGSPWEYDTHVPLLWLGAAVRPGHHARPTNPPQIAPTLARMLGVDAPSGNTVESLYEVLE
jgi:predicted AlkP superfamily pyrophosphatase or phosphodiesterase